MRKGKHEKKSAPATWALAAPFVPVARPGTKGHPLLSRTGVPGWETGTTGVSQPGQINVFVVVGLEPADWSPTAGIRSALPQLLAHVQLKRMFT